MRVLVLESEPRAADTAIDQLEAAGHDVVRCHERDGAAFPCVGLDHHDRCPLNGTPVDVALTVRGDERWTTSELEDGVPCAIRSGVPLVVAGESGGSPYAPWTTATVHGDDVVSACDWAATAPLTRHSDAATASLRETLARHGVTHAEAAGATVTRSRGRLCVRLTMPDSVAEDVAQLGATRAMAALRAMDPDAAGMDITLGDGDQ
ncbi:MAG TPA: hypothetical protein VFF40_08780 [Acidimicrobiia bacterium]|nr:hypothetical protein [Acidimicrobiia bacterium]